jgi:hypothetical protein
MGTDSDKEECKIQLDVAMDILALTSALLKDVIFSGPDNAIESAYASLRAARIRFFSARAAYRNICQSDSH